MVQIPNCRTGEWPGVSGVKPNQIGAGWWHCFSRPSAWRWCYFREVCLLTSWSFQLHSLVDSLSGGKRIVASTCFWDKFRRHMATKLSSVFLVRVSADFLSNFMPQSDEYRSSQNWYSTFKCLTNFSSRSWPHQNVCNNSPRPWQHSYPLAHS